MRTKALNLICSMIADNLKLGSRDIQSSTTQLSTPMRIYTAISNEDSKSMNVTSMSASMLMMYQIRRWAARPVRASVHASGHGAASAFRPLNPYRAGSPRPLRRVRRCRNTIKFFTLGSAYLGDLEGFVEEKPAPPWTSVYNLPPAKAPEWAPYEDPPNTAGDNGKKGYNHIRANLVVGRRVEGPRREEGPRTAAQAPAPTLALPYPLFLLEALGSRSRTDETVVDRNVFFFHLPVSWCVILYQL